MKNKSLKTIVGLLLIFSVTSFAQSKSSFYQNDTIYHITAIEKQRLIDSVQRAQLEAQISNLTDKDNAIRKKLQNQLDSINAVEKEKIILRKSHIDSLRKTAVGYPVLGVKSDTLFFVYTKIGALTAKDRALNISSKIETLYEDDFFKADSVTVVQSEFTHDIVYGETIIMSISDTDALWYNTTPIELALNFEKKIETSILDLKEERKLSNILIRFGWASVAIGIIWFLVWLFKRGHRWLLARIESRKENWLKNLKYKDYTFLSAEQELKIIFLLLKIVRWTVLLLVIYIALPIVFSIFPFTRHWADVLFHLIWSPFKTIFISFWEYLPNLFRILVIYFVMKYIIKFVKFIFKEIETEKLQVAGFHSDWAVPTFNIIRFLLYAFMFVLIFPLLPGSHSDIFRGVSVFVGVLISLGSSTAIANMVAGLVITYMRPFQIGDRIKIADVVGDVVEKSLLVTRIRTPKNEIITIPNASVLSGNTVNYSSDAKDRGLILHTTVTIGYDVPWKDMYQALIDAALQTELILQDPKPFVLQTSLDDFYVAYQINAYTREASRQAYIYSLLHENIQNVCNERGIEIMSPHYRSERDGNNSTIPANYRSKD